LRGDAVARILLLWKVRREGKIQRTRQGQGGRGKRNKRKCDQREERGTRKKRRGVDPKKERKTEVREGEIGGREEKGKHLYKLTGY